MITFKRFLSEATIVVESEFKKLQKNKKPLSKEEAEECLAADCVWHFGNKDKPSPAVWKSVNKNGKTTYVTNTHRCYQTAPTLKGAMKKFFDVVKDTA